MSFDLTQAPATNPISIYRYRDGLYAVDLITAALKRDFFSWLEAHPSTQAEVGEYFGFAERPVDVMVTLFVANGWWEHPESIAGDPEWKFHPAAFGGGGAQMYAYDVNGDGLNDVITSLQAHGYGLAWFEQYREGGEIKFRQHLIMGSEPKENRYGLKFSQLHAIDLIDMDGDGLKDLVTGKRFWAHGPGGDAEPDAPAVIYWFKLVRHADKSTDWIPQFVDDDSGVGTQVLAMDINGDKLPDIIVGNKKGTFVHLHETRKVTQEEWQKAQPTVRYAR